MARRGWSGMRPARRGPSLSQQLEIESQMKEAIRLIESGCCWCEACGVSLTAENASVWAGGPITLVCIPCRDFLGPDIIARSVLYPPGYLTAVLMGEA